MCEQVRVLDKALRALGEWLRSTGSRRSLLALATSGRFSDWGISLPAEDIALVAKASSNLLPAIEAATR
jgi:hypothetical protein